MSDSKTITMPLYEWKQSQEEMKRLKNVNHELSIGKSFVNVENFELKCFITCETRPLYSPIDYQKFIGFSHGIVDNLEKVDFDHISKEAHDKVISKYKEAINEALEINVKSFAEMDSERWGEILNLRKEVASNESELTENKKVLKVMQLILSISFVINVFYFMG